MILNLVLARFDHAITIDKADSFADNVNYVINFVYARFITNSYCGEFVRVGALRFIVQEDD